MWDSCVVWNLRSGPNVPESQQVGIPQTLAENKDPPAARPACREMPNLSQEVAPRAWGQQREMGGFRLWLQFWLPHRLAA